MTSDRLVARLLAIALLGAGAPLATPSADLAAAAAAASVRVQPARARIELGEDQAFHAVVRGKPGAGVNWLVEGVPGGDADVGTITRSGRYHAPLEGAVPRTITITAVSRANSAVFGTATVELIAPPPAIDAVEPQVVSPGPLALTLTGRYFAPGMTVYLGGAALTTTYVSETQLGAVGTLATKLPGRAKVTVIDAGPPARRSPPAFVTVEIKNVPEVTITPQNATIPAASTQQFTATYTGPGDAPFAWAVNGVPGGNDVLGHIDDYGRYQGPDLPPDPPTVTISATTDTNPSYSATTQLTLTNPHARIAAVFPLGVRPGDFTVTVRGFGFMPTSQALFDGVPAVTTYVSPTRLAVSATASRAASRTATIAVVNPDPGGSTSDPASLTILSDPSSTEYQATTAEAGRLLEQASFGPDAVSIDRVRELGIDGWIAEQLATPESPYPELRGKCRDIDVPLLFARHMLRGEDQLRQRAIFALGQVFVVSSNKVGDSVAMLGWQRMLSRNALGNFRTLMDEVTLDPAMGHFLDLANSEKASADGAIIPNENYAREIMQLFTLGLVRLNHDGSPMVDGEGKTVPVYSQADVAELSRAMTGWGYAPESGAGQTWPTEQNFYAPLQAYDVAHDTGVKHLLLGVTIPAGGTARADMTAALDSLFHHPNVAPFIATRLIRALVKSNPSPAYIDRVATVFDDDGKGTRGNLAAVFRAVLTDDEARDPGGATEGKLREPVLYFTGVLRALDGQYIGENAPRFASAADMGQTLLAPPSVFNYYSPLREVGPGFFAPEMQIYNPTASVARANLVYRYLNESYSGEVRIDLEPYAALTPTPAALVDRVDATFFYGRMSPELRAALIDTVSAQTDSVGRRRMSALYLALTSGEYLVQH